MSMVKLAKFPKLLNNTQHLNSRRTCNMICTMTQNGVSCWWIFFCVVESLEFEYHYYLRMSFVLFTHRKISVRIFIENSCIWIQWPYKGWNKPVYDSRHFVTGGMLSFEKAVTKTRIDCSFFEFPLKLRKKSEWIMLYSFYRLLFYETQIVKATCEWLFMNIII